MEDVRVSRGPAGRGPISPTCASASRRSLAEIVLARRVSRRGPNARLRRGAVHRAADLQASGGVGWSPSSGSTSTGAWRWRRPSSTCWTGSAGAPSWSPGAELAAAQTRAREKPRRGSRSSGACRPGVRDLDLLAVRDRGDRGARPQRGGEGGARRGARAAAPVDALIAAAGAGGEAIAPENGEGGAAQLLAEAEVLAEAVFRRRSRAGRVRAAAGGVAPRGRRPGRRAAPLRRRARGSPGGSRGRGAARALTSGSSANTVAAKGGSPAQRSAAGRSASACSAPR